MSPCSVIEEVSLRLKVPPFVTETVPVGSKAEAFKLTELSSKVPPLCRISPPLFMLRELMLDNVSD